jgi:hypothetical protein
MIDDNSVATRERSLMIADDRENSDTQGDQESSAGALSAQGHNPGEQQPGVGSDVVATNAPILSAATGQASGGRKQPASSITVETSRISEVAAGRSPGIMIVPYEENSTFKSTSRHEGLSMKDYSKEH